MNNLENKMQGGSEFATLQDNVIVENSPEGIRILVMDSTSRSVFKPKSTELQPYMIKLFEVIGNLIKTVPNHVSIDGHTSDVADGSLRGVDQWRLSADRADSVRRSLAHVLKKEQLLKVTGRANTDPYDTKNPSSSKNSRIAITLMDPAFVNKIQKSDPGK